MCWAWHGMTYHAHTKHMQRQKWREHFSFCFRSRSIPLSVWNSQYNSCYATAAAVAVTHGILYILFLAIAYIKRSFRVLIKKNSFSKRRRTMEQKLKSWLLAKSSLFAWRIQIDILKYTYAHSATLTFRVQSVGFLIFFSFNLPYNPQK